MRRSRLQRTLSALALAVTALTMPPYAAANCPASTASVRSSVPPLFARQQGDVFQIGLAPEHFGVPMMWSTRIESASLGAGFNGLPVGDRMVSFDRVGSQVLLRQLGTLRAGEGEGRLAARFTDAPWLMATLQPSESTEQGRVWLNVTSQILSFGPDSESEKWWEYFLGLLSAPTLIDSLSRPLEARHRADAAQFRVELSFSASARLPAGGSGFDRPGGDFGQRSSATATVLHSLALLPIDPMPVRTSDPRVGFISVPVQNYGGAAMGATVSSRIARFRLEAQCIGQARYGVVRPIVFYLAPEVPQSWRPAIRAGIMDWAPAFAAAGHANAIEVRDEPPEPDWNPADPRFNVVRWVAQPIGNAIGKPMLDPRTGEILSASLILWSGVITHFLDQYMASVGDANPSNPRSADQELQDEILRYVVSHETGHAIGLLHNHKAASAYPLSALKNLEFTRRYGTSASIMSYGRFNHLASTDGRPGGFVPRLGPYDFYAIRWGYGAEERSAGENWVPDRPDINISTDRLLEFSSDEQASELDAQAVHESIGDDRTASAAEGLARLRSTWQRVNSAAVATPQDVGALQRQFQAALVQRSHLLRSLVKVIGGKVESRRAALSRGQQAWVSVPATEQRKSLALLLQAFGDDAMHAEIARAGARLQAGPAHAGLVASYKLAFAELLQPLRLAQLRSQAETGPSVGELLATLQTSLFSASAIEPMSPVRLELQSMYLSRLRALLLEPQVVPLVRASGVSAEVPSHALDLSIEARMAVGELARACRLVAQTHRIAAVRQYYAALATSLSAPTFAGPR